MKFRFEKGDPETVVHFAYSPQAVKDFKLAAKERVWRAADKTWLVPAEQTYKIALVLTQLGHETHIVDTPFSRLAELESRVAEMEGILDTLTGLVNSLLGVGDGDDGWTLDDVIESLTKDGHNLDDEEAS